MPEGKWYSLDTQEVLKSLNSDSSTGLSESKVLVMRSKGGVNVLPKKRGDSFFLRLYRHIVSPLVLVLLGAFALTILLSEYLDAIVIAAAASISIVLGIIQEGRASKAFEKLAASASKFATVIRDGKRKQISIEDVVVGDIVSLEPGSGVPADVRLISASNLSINEAALTGEWVAVEKQTEAISGNVSVASQHNMAFMGTLVATGSGKGIVVSVGSKTEFGKIAENLNTEQREVTTLTRNVRKIARFLILVISLAVGAIFALGLFRGEPLIDMIVVSIAVAVAAVPSGLPAAVTVVLALGMEAILSRGGLVRSLLAAETLGSTTVILTDKTGTLTQATMAVSGLYTLTGIQEKNNKPEGDNYILLEMAVSSSDAYIESKEGEEYVVRGRPVERAILEAGLEIGLAQNRVGKERLDLLAFESSRRFAISLNRHTATENHLYISGAPEAILERSSYVLERGSRRALSEEERELFAKTQQELSAQGFRFIAVGYRTTELNRIPPDLLNEAGREIVERLVFVGLIAFEDPIRKDVPEAMRVVQNAGVRVVVVTGDNPETARTIAKEAGIRGVEDAPPLLGSDLERMGDSEVITALKTHSVFARILPEQKLRIANLLKNEKEIVAMTGDGVNDAPALRAAHIGIAVGSGTEVAKEASDMVLLNNSFSIIVDAIAEGRRIFDNLRKIIAYLLSTSFSEIVLIGGALFLGAPLPLLPTQILWANIVEEGLMSFAFAFEPKDSLAMKRDPRAKKNATILTRQTIELILIITAVTGGLLLALFMYLRSLNLPIEEIRTVMFVALSLDSIFFTFSFKNLELPLWRISLWSNRYLIFALLGSITALIAALVLPPLQKLLTIVPLTTFDLVLLTGFGLINLLSIEVLKWLLFRGRVR